MKRGDGAPTPPPNCAGCRFAIVSARFYTDLAEMLVNGATRALSDCSVAKDDVRYVEVPGCFELPLACRNLIATERYDGIVALGVVIRGETPHFDYVAGECARGIMNVQLATGTPIAFGVLTTENFAQAHQRASRDGGDKGYEAAVAAAMLVQELWKVGRT